MTTAAALFATVVLGGLAVLLNAISRSRAERIVMTPVCVVLAACSLIIATG
jgi:hypothetical protein